APPRSRGHCSRCPSPGVRTAPRAPRGRRAGQCARNSRIGAAELSGRSRRIPDAAVGRRRAIPGRAGSGRGRGGLPDPTRHAAAVDRRGVAAVKQITIGLLGAALMLTGCKKAPAPSQATAGMKNMQGMPGMPAAGADTSGVQQGEPLLALYSPDLVSAQEEYLLARRLKDDTLAASARRRLALWDIPDDQIDSLETRGSVTRTLLLRAPRSGEVTEKMVIEGQ